MAVNNSALTSAGKPKVGGAIYRAPLGTTLPTDASTALASAFTCIGYISDDGLVEGNSVESEVIKAWGGDPVLTIMTSFENTFKFSMLGIMDPDALKVIYGDTNVTGTLSTGITAKTTLTDRGNYVFVIEEVLNGNVPMRTVIPSAKVSDMDDITHKDDEAIKLGITLSAAADSNGVTNYKYIGPAA